MTSLHLNCSYRVHRIEFSADCVIRTSDSARVFRAPSIRASSTFLLIGWVRLHTEHRKSTVAFHVSSSVHVQPLSTVAHQTRQRLCSMRAQTCRTNRARPGSGARPRSAVISNVVESKVAMRTRDAAEVCFAMMGRCA